MSKPETRGQRLGFVPKAHARPAKRFADASRARVQGIAYLWSELDNAVVIQCDELIAAIDEFEKCLEESIKMMNEPVDQD